METMKGLQKVRKGFGHLEMVELPRPAPSEDEVVVEVRYAGICGTDVHIFHDKFAHVRPPVTLGHEFAGVVAELGAGIKGWHLGDRVTAESAAFLCGSCDHCLAGETQRCDNRLAHGIGKDGGFAQFVRVRGDALHRLPEHISFQEGALTEPLAVAIHAVMERSDPHPGKKAMITGPGVIGLMVFQVLKAMDVKAVISGTPRDEARLKVASRLGAETVVIAGQSSVLDAVAELTQGRGADVAFECSGSPKALGDCIRLVRKGGQIVQVGLMGGPVELDYDQLAMKELELKGCFTHNHGTWVRALQLMQGRKILLEPLISGLYPISRWEEAFRRFEEGTGLKYLLHPAEE